MSRSRKHTPITGVTPAPSEKADKRHTNRVLRRDVRQRLAGGADETDLPRRREILDPDSMAKDGKTWFDPAERPEAMRK